MTQPNPDQTSAERLHAEIMAMEVNHRALRGHSSDYENSYVVGHRVARCAAADLARQRMGEVEREQLTLACVYDPNCPGYDFDEQKNAMLAARQVIESVQEAAEYLGKDPEGCLTDICDELMGKIESLETENATLRAERYKAQQVEAIQAVPNPYKQERYNEDRATLETVFEEARAAFLQAVEGAMSQADKGALKP
jgi:hypothetical protein